MRRGQGRAFHFRSFLPTHHPVRSRPPRGSLVSAHLSRGISGRADIGSTLSSRTKRKGPSLTTVLFSLGSSLSSALPLPSFRAGVRLFVIPLPDPAYSPPHLSTIATTTHTTIQPTRPHPETNKGWNNR